MIEGTKLLGADKKLHLESSGTFSSKVDGDFITYTDSMLPGGTFDVIEGEGEITIECYGYGGNGGRGRSPQQGYRMAGAGGGGGAFVRKTLKVKKGDSFTTSASWFSVTVLLDTVTVVEAANGQDGFNATHGPVPGGSGGKASDCIGDVILPGGNGSSHGIGGFNPGPDGGDSTYPKTNQNGEHGMPIGGGGAGGVSDNTQLYYGGQGARGLIFVKYTVKA